MERSKVKIVEPDTVWSVRKDLMALQREQRWQWIAIYAIGGAIAIQGWNAVFRGIAHSR